MFIFNNIAPANNSFINTGSMTEIADELVSIVSKHGPALHQLGEDQLQYKSSPSKWSRKEILGHLVDSAQTNIRRLVISQYEERPAIVYDQDKWVAINGYQHWVWPELVELWRLQNLQLAAILRNSVDHASRECMTQAVHTLDWLASDYIKHLRHHLHQVLDLEPVPYP